MRQTGHPGRETYRREQSPLVANAVQQPDLSRPRRGAARAADPPAARSHGRLGDSARASVVGWARGDPQGALGHRSTFSPRAPAAYLITAGDRQPPQAR